MRKIPLMLMLAALILAGCQAAIQTPSPEHKTPLSGTYDVFELTAIPEQTAVPQETPAPPGGVQAAREALAALLNLPVDSILISRFEVAQWPDSCLGLGSSGEACSQQLVDGYSVVLEANNQFYEFRTDAGGSIVRPVDTTLGEPAGVEASRQALAALLSLTPDDIQVDDVQTTTWSDACLGVNTSDTACAQVLIPGFRVLLSVNGISYEYHTSQDGSQVALANILAVPLGQSYLQVEVDPGQADCQYFQIGLNSAAYGACNASLSNNTFPNTNRSQELSDLLARFASFTAGTPAGRVTFSGHGGEVATPEQQRAIAAWAKLAALDAAGLAADSNPGLIISWQRSGGITGLCSQLQIYDSGWAYLGPCVVDENGLVNRLFLSSQELQIMYNWVGAYSAVEYSTNEGVADGYQYDLSFRGGGTEQVPDSIENEMNQFAQNVFAEFSP